MQADCLASKRLLKLCEMPVGKLNVCKQDLKDQILHTKKAKLDEKLIDQAEQKLQDVEAYAERMAEMKTRLSAALQRERIDEAEVRQLLSEARKSGLSSGTPEFEATEQLLKEIIVAMQTLDQALEGESIAAIESANQLLAGLKLPLSPEAGQKLQALKAAAQLKASAAALKQPAPAPASVDLISAASDALAAVAAAETAENVSHPVPISPAVTVELSVELWLRSKRISTDVSEICDELGVEFAEDLLDLEQSDIARISAQLKQAEQKRFARALAALSE